MEKRYNETNHHLAELHAFECGFMGKISFVFKRGFAWLYTVVSCYDLLKEYVRSKCYEHAKRLI